MQDSVLTLHVSEECMVQSVYSKGCTMVHRQPKSLIICGFNAFCKLLLKFVTFSDASTWRSGRQEELPNRMKRTASAIVTYFIEVGQELIDVLRNSSTRLRTARTTGLGSRPGSVTKYRLRMILIPLMFTLTKRWSSSSR